MSEKVFTPYFRKKLKAMAIKEGLNMEEAKELVKRFEDDSAEGFFKAIERGIRDGLKEVDNST